MRSGSENSSWNSGLVNVPLPLSAVHVRDVWACAADTPSGETLTASTAIAPSVVIPNTRFNTFLKDRRPFGPIAVEARRESGHA